MPFRNELKIKPVNGNEWELLDSLCYVSAAGKSITVPAGFQMDLASIPRIFRPMFPVHGKHTRAAVVHDWLYANRIGKRKAADELFLDIMKELGVSYIKRHTMYAAVRAGGWLYWDDVG